MRSVLPDEAGSAPISGVDPVAETELPGGLIEVNLAGGRYALPARARRREGLECALAVGAQRLGHPLVPLHPLGAACTREECWDLMAGDLLSDDGDVTVPGDADRTVTVSGGALADWVAQWGLGLSARRGAVVALEGDACPERRWVWCSAPSRAQLDALSSRLTVPAVLVAADEAASRSLVRTVVERLDALSLVQLAVITDDATGLIEATVGQGVEAALGSRALPFRVLAGFLSDELEVHIPTALLPLRLAGSDASLRAGLFERPAFGGGAHSVTVAPRRPGEEWVIQVALGHRCGTRASATLRADDAGTLRGQSVLTDEGVTSIPWDWSPEAGESVELRGALWAAELRVDQEREQAPRWRSSRGDHAVTGVVERSELHANPLDGTRYWRLLVTVPMACAGCGRTAYRQWVTVLARWGGERLVAGETRVSAQGRLAVAVVPGRDRR